MASIGPPALGAKGCVERLRRFAQGATAVEGAFKFIEGASLYKTIQSPCGRRKCIPPFGGVRHQGGGKPPEVADYRNVFHAL